jgi:hypothetical protein
MPNKDEILAKIGELMEDHNRKNPFEELGKAMAEAVHEKTYCPRLSQLEFILLHSAVKRNDTEMLEMMNRRYQRGCDFFVEKFGVDKLWGAVSKIYDGQEYRKQLEDSGREVNITNLFILMEERNAQLLP